MKKNGIGYAASQFKQKKRNERGTDGTSTDKNPSLENTCSETSSDDEYRNAEYITDVNADDSVVEDTDGTTDSILDIDSDRCDPDYEEWVKLKQRKGEKGENLEAIDYLDKSFRPTRPPKRWGGSVASRRYRNRAKVLASREEVAQTKTEGVGAPSNWRGALVEDVMFVDEEPEKTAGSVYHTAPDCPVKQKWRRRR